MEVAGPNSVLDWLSIILGASMTIAGFLATVMYILVTYNQLRQSSR
jgi:hypothetical protein